MRDMLNTHSWSSPVKLIISLAITFAFGALSMFFLGGESWYEALEKLPWSPRYSHYRFVWIPTHILMGLSLWQLWLVQNGSRLTALYVWFWIMVLLATLWTAAFFGLQCTHCGLVVVFLLLFTLFFTIQGFYQHSKTAALLLVPYFVWVLALTIVNGYILLFNPPVNTGYWWDIYG